MVFDWTLAIGLVVTAALVAAAGLLALTALEIGDRRRPVSIFTAETPLTVFLFDGERLVDATPPARALIAEGAGDPLSRALSRLEPMFPGLATRLEGIQREGRFVLCSRQGLDPPMVLRAEWLGGLVRLSVVDDDTDQMRTGTDGATEVALQDDLANLRAMLADAPVPVWRTDAEGRVVWANTPYVRAALDRLEPGKELGWPLPALFDADGGDRQALAMIGQTAGATAANRAWFDIARVAMPQGTTFYALPADRLVKAETDLAQFTQTLAKTFAGLPIGLAVFDARRVLHMFNPALIDLTGLPVDFLTGRPTLPLLLDAMRERQMIPEPRDYRSWRRQLVEMETAAASGLFQDTWALPGGQTYRITGRPHPGGALAFMIEDISTEMLRTRRYRADLELGQAVIDAMSDAVVVFAQDGAIAMSNAAATALWGEDGISPPDAGRGEPGAIRHWRMLTAPTLLWNDLAVYIGSFGPRDPWDGEVRMADGRAVECRVAPMPHGSTLVSFRVAGARNAAPEMAPPGRAAMSG